MIGALAGDIIGSPYEWMNNKSYSFPLFIDTCRFTDDTVLTIALADSILYKKNFIDNLKDYYKMYPEAGYGGYFIKWASSLDRMPYNSWGNGSAMRVSPVGFACGSIETVLEEAKRSAMVTHNHPEGIKGAQATAAAVFLAKQSRSKKEIKEYIEKNFKYDLSIKLDQIRKNYKFDVSCQGSVPQAITAFLESTNFEDAIRKAISIGGDSDTIACITGGIAHAYYKFIPEFIRDKVLDMLDFRLSKVTIEFCNRFSC